MPDQPRLAIVIACFNYERFVGRAIGSVLDHQDADCEVVVVDDGSTDSSWDVIAASGARAYRTTNAGQRAACLFGLDRTSAPFVLFLDADDVLEPGALRVILSKLDARVAKLQFPLTRIDAQGREISGPHPRLATFRDRDAIARQVLRTGVYTTPPTSGNVFRRDVCELLRAATYDRAVDGVMLFAAPFLGDIVSLAEPLARYRIHGGNDSGLGRAPSPALLARDLRRFVDRMTHLRQWLSADAELVRPEDTFYYHYLMWRIDLASDRKPSVRRLLPLLNLVLEEQFPVAKKLAFASYFTATALLPPGAARSLLALRSVAGG